MIGAKSAKICPISDASATKLFDDCSTLLRNRPKATLLNTSKLVSLTELVSEKHVAV